jgi:hypothetical protein
MQSLIKILELVSTTAQPVPILRCLDSVQYQNVITHVEIVQYARVPLAINLKAILDVVAIEYFLQPLYLPS